MKLSRRDFIKGSGAAALLAALPIAAGAEEVEEADGYSEAGYSDGLFEIMVEGETYYVRLYEKEQE